MPKVASLSYNTSETERSILKRDAGICGTISKEFGKQKAIEVLKLGQYLDTLDVNEGLL